MGLQMKKQDETDYLVERIRDQCSDSFENASEFDWCECCLEALDVVVTGIKMRREELEDEEDEQ